MQEIYLDNSASTPPLPEVVKAVSDTMTSYIGNPSSSHSRGDAARDLIEESRAAVAALVGSVPESIIFTSGATESNNLAIRGASTKKVEALRIITSTVEHSSILAVVTDLENSGADILRLPVCDAGLVDIDALKASLEMGADLLSVQWVNNETGVIQPIDEIASLAKRFGVPLHVDAAQAYGKLPIDIPAIDVDYLSISAHKIHGPLGIGALYVKDGAPLRSQILGGSQEAGRRAGTENLPGIAGFGVAARVRRSFFDPVIEKTKTLRNEFEGILTNRLPGISINGAKAPRIGGVTNLRFDRVDGQALTARLDQEGVICSQSSACTNHRPEPSYVLRAMGLTEDEAYSSVRFAFSSLNSIQEITEAAAIVEKTIRKMRAFEGTGAFAA